MEQLRQCLFKMFSMEAVGVVSSQRFGIEAVEAVSSQKVQYGGS
jgi:hypothetical protein